MDKIKFKYHPNVWGNDIFSKNKDGSMAVCQCCSNKTEYYIENMYTSENVACICQKCISSGEAAIKFNGCFIQDAEFSKVDDKSKHEELLYRTPGYLSWQGEYWLACCNDFCEYIGEVGTKELDEMRITYEVFEEYYNRDSYYEDAREYLVKGGSMAGYLFRCLNCGKYHLWVDAD